MYCLFPFDYTRVSTLFAISAMNIAEIAYNKRMMIDVLCRRNSVSGIQYMFACSDMAQDLFQVLGMWHDSQYEELQRL